ncbi:MAG TPA: EutN/CcmL family microcompartment protein [Anaerolineales bacterium]|nr:EutN/CcmL family microcompartment protein [Anaerolineales bacterium]
MKIARVIGSTISTIEDPKVKETKLLLCQPTNEAGKEMGKTYVAIDLVDAGTGDLVLTCHGSAARQTYLTKDAPVDAVIMAVIDHLQVDGEIVFRK